MPDSTATTPTPAQPPAAPSPEVAAGILARRFLPMSEERSSELLRWLLSGGSFTQGQTIELGAELLRLGAIERGAQDAMRAIIREEFASVRDGRAVAA